MKKNYKVIYTVRSRDNNQVLREVESKELTMAEALRFICSVSQCVGNCESFYVEYDYQEM